MPAYIIINIEVTDPDKFSEYQALAKSTMGQYGVKLLAKSTSPEALEGTWPSPIVVMLEFETEEKAKQWYASPEYAKAIAAREGAARFDTIILPGA